MQRAARLLPLALIASVVSCEQWDRIIGRQPATEESCTKLGEAWCKELGEKSPTCTQAQTAIKMLPPAACQKALSDLDYSKKAIAGLRESCTQLVDKLCKDIGEETETCAMVRRETPKFPPDRCSSMLESYDKVLADLKRREAANKPLSAEKQKELTAGELGTFGPENAKVTIIEFSDFECPYCSRAATTVGKIKEKYADKVRFAFKHFPLSFHKNARPASIAVLAAGEQGKFWEYHDVLFKNQKALDEASLEKYAEELGLDMEKFKEALKKEAYAEAVDKDMKAGQEIGVSGTPTLYINGKKVSNPTDFDTVAKAIDSALEGGG